MPLDPTWQKNVIDWITGAASPSAPTAWWLNWATASPNFTSAFDGAFTTRARMTFAAANSPQGSATNLGTKSGGTCTAAASVIGWNLYDAGAAGNRIMYGTFSAGINYSSGADMPFIRPGDLKITLL